MNLKFRLNLIITSLLALVMLAGALFTIKNARDDVRAEIQSTTVLALHLLDAEILHYASDSQWVNTDIPDPASIFRLKTLDNVRHLRIEFFDSRGNLRESNHLEKTDQEGAPPAWFLKLMSLVSPVMQPTQRPVVVNRQLLGNLVVTPDPSYEIAEIWNDILSLLVLGLVFFVVVNGMVYWAVGRALRPVDRILHALTELELGNWDARLPSFTLPELSSIGTKFNAMAETLQLSVRNNHRLTQQIITLQEEERKNLARDLHDEVGQHLTAINVDASAILNARTLEEARDSAEAIGKVARQMMDIVHDMLQRLRPGVLEELGLEAALKELADTFNYRNRNITAKLVVSGYLNAVPDIVAIAVYRLVQECLTNVTRHSHASNVSIEAEMKGSKLNLKVIDNGVGFSSAAATTGFGLAGMRERVDSLNGQFSINSSNSGTVVTAILPIGNSL